MCRTLATADYKEGVVAEDDAQVTFEFRTPYIIAATPASTKEWGVYEPGCKNGLIVQGKSDATVSVSVDRGRTWSSAVSLGDKPDLTDQVKRGSVNDRLWRERSAKTLRRKRLDNDDSLPGECGDDASCLKDGGSTVIFASSGKSLNSAGPTLSVAQTQGIAGAF